MQSSTHIASRPGTRKPNKGTEPETASGMRLPSPRIDFHGSNGTSEVQRAESRWTAGAGVPLTGLVHDARNLLSALHLYCNLLEEPGVLAPEHTHYAEDLQTVANAASRLVEQMTWVAGRPGKDSSLVAGLQTEGTLVPTLGGESVSLHAGNTSTTLVEPEYLPLEAPAVTVDLGSMAASGPVGRGGHEAVPTSIWRESALQRERSNFESSLIEDLGQAVRSLRPLLSALAGPAIELEVDCLASEGRIRLTPEDLTRILVNLVGNAAEAMTHTGTVRITVQKRGGSSFLETHSATDDPHTVLMTVQDTGTGIPSENRERIFKPGFSTKMGFHAWPANAHRGLGLSIALQLVGLSGGSMQLVSEAGRGARFEMEFPLLERASHEATAVTDSLKGRRIEC